MPHPRTATYGVAVVPHRATPPSTRPSDRPEHVASGRRDVIAAPAGLGGTRPRAARRGPSGPRAEESGFTLVELLVVVLVIGALVAIAVPTFVGQRERAFDAAVTSELRAAGVALESYRAQNGSYSMLALAPGSGWGFEPSGNLTMRTEDVSASAYCLIAQHVSRTSPNLNTTWRIREDTTVERIETANGTCTSAKLTTQP